MLDALPVESKTQVAHTAASAPFIRRDQMGESKGVKGLGMTCVLF
jgi:hypothetical protein